MDIERKYRNNYGMASGHKNMFIDKVVHAFIKKQKTFGFTFNVCLGYVIFCF